MEVKTKHKAYTDKKYLTIGVNCQLKLSDVKLIAYKAIPIILSPGSHLVMEDSYRFLKLCVDQRIPIYGVNTQFGDQASHLDSNLYNTSQSLYEQSIRARQENLIKSLACGVGDEVSPEVIKLTMVLRAHCLSQGYSGVTPATMQAILDYLNAGIVPIIYEYGSIGASGDLIPLAMIAAGLIGENVDVLYKGEIIKAPQAIERAGLKKIKPQLREGLALMNGTSFMTAIASLALCDLQRLFKQMLAAIAIALESMLVINSAYHPLVHQLKKQTGEMIVNDFLINFWEGSQLLTDLDELRDVFLKNNSQSVPENPKRSVQDYYSLRSVAQGFGSFQENLQRCIQWIENEMNSINDNPIIDAANEKIYYGANFMGYYVTDACDILKMNIAQASSWIHALLANLLHPRKNHSLPTNLVEKPEKNNGFRSFQLLAAALAVQNRKLAQSQQAFMIPTEGDNQDVNSLGAHAAFDLRESVTNLERLTAILLLTSTQALELRGIQKASKKSQVIYQIIRESSPALLNCRIMLEDINAVIRLLKEEMIYV